MYAITKEEIQDLIGEKDIIGNYFQIELLDFSENFAECAMPLTDKHKNPLGIAHGGAIFSLADLCFEAACHACGRFCVNSQSSLSFLNKGIGDKLFARADLLKKRFKNGRLPDHHYGPGKNCCRAGADHRILPWRC